MAHSVDDLVPALAAQPKVDGATLLSDVAAWRLSLSGLSSKPGQPLRAMWCWRLSIRRRQGRRHLHCECMAWLQPPDCGRASLRCCRR
ncbi:conserved hypothetical protein [Xanthomonas citri pv. fuscans]|uniref:Uncharacterized protein n=1 Tax=Xanthomonas citri pv. phaseoli var. fuscans TaxID=473423 RepID=A0A808FGE6_XANCI|nr:hypothetical protein DGN16_04240 [Xanthomonas citri pv. fuscans]QWN06761.1 hypothetical protein DGN11_04260 [Xanthomonas citri pv. fuscans]QWN10891.1 hypothetical protein DGN07_04195 [Xanthomonas citri pv. fuscans]SON80841.1 conserved hypothetical protein [Xanthomonas citri pv. fuscans]SOO00947.1 conserved hypothetical protein [Xanthomonas citri pv. fuscans]